MSYQCSDCGEIHDELPRYFMCRKPEREDGSVIDVALERKSMCRSDEACFVLCEVELPLCDASGPPLGYICWVNVAAEDYGALLRFRENEHGIPNPGTIAGTLANGLRSIPDSFGTRVRFEVVAGDPTPYVKWVAPRSTLARRLSEGVTAAFWHSLAAGFR
ncbi:MAG TPA: DUF2199 domain-containing protein [Polyangiaceae bacterium]